MKKNEQPQPIEEKVENVAEEQQATSKINVIKVEKNDDVNTLVNRVEEERNALRKSLKKTSTINNILLVVVAGVFIGSFILVTQGTWGQITGWTLIGVTIAGLVVYYLLTRKKYPTLTRKYFHTFWEGTNNYLFSGDKFSDCEIDIDERYETSDIIAQMAYKDVVSVASRNIVRGKYDGKEFVFGELGIYRPGAKRNQRDVVFVGRHLSFDNNLQFEGRYIVNIRKEEAPVDLPTEIEDLKPLHEEGLLTIYGLEGADYEKDLGKTLINDIKSLACKDPLLNINFVFWSKKTFCYLSYDDAIVAIPFEKNMDGDSYVEFKKNIEDVFAILSK